MSKNSGKRSTKPVEEEVEIQADPVCAAEEVSVEQQYQIRYFIANDEKRVEELTDFLAETYGEVIEQGGDVIYIRDEEMTFDYISITGEEGMIRIYLFLTREQGIHKLLALQSHFRRTDVVVYISASAIKAFNLSSISFFPDTIIVGKERMADVFGTESSFGNLEKEIVFAREQKLEKMRTLESRPAREPREKKQFFRKPRRDAEDESQEKKPQQPRRNDRRETRYSDQSRGKKNYKPRRNDREKSNGRETQHSYQQGSYMPPAQFRAPAQSQTMDPMLMMQMMQDMMARMGK